MTIKTLPPEQKKFILIGATGKLGKSITENNIITYGICSKKNPLVGKKIDHILQMIEKDTLKKETLAGCIVKKVNHTVIITKEY